jgi:glycosyltransferase involved in cell wall biosynthesis
VTHPEVEFSVIVPAFNKPAGLRDCLKALARQSFPAERFEVIVVDDGSVPPLAPVVQEFGARLQTTYIRVKNGGPAAARNHGARAARGRFLACTDHDCVPAANWLSALHDGFARHPECLLGGPKENGLPDNLCSTAHQIASDYAEQWFRRSADRGGYYTTNNLAVPREAFLRIGGFNTAFAFAHEDREFGARWADHGMRRAWMPDAVVRHRHELDLRSFLRQHFRYGAGAVDFLAARRRASARAGIRFEGLRFHLGLLAVPFKHHAAFRGLLLVALLASAQAAYLGGILVETATRRR